MGRRVALLALITLLATALYTAASASSSPARSRGNSPDATTPAPAPSGAETASAPTSRAGYVPALLRQFAADTPVPVREVVETYAYDAASASCTSTPKDSFQLNETVCVRVTGGPSLTLLGRRLSLTGPAGNLRDPANTDAGATSPLTGAVSTLSVTGDPQTFAIRLPSTATSVIDGVTVDNRGEWRVNSLLGTRFVIRTTATFTVSEANSPSADLAVYNNLGADPAGVAAGATVEYVLWVVNRGPDAANNVTVSDSVVADASLVSATQIGGAAFTCTNPGTNGNCPSGVWTIAQMARRSAATFRLTYQISGGASAGSVVTNTASVTSDTPDPAPANNTSDADITLASGAAAGPCVLDCPSDINQAADTTDANDAPGAIVTFEAANTSGSCGSITSSHPSGSFFPVGTTQVTISGEGASCTFNVTVVNTAAPTVSCPADVEVNVTDSCNAASVNIGTPTASAGSTVTGERSDGQALDAQYPAGTTTVTWTAADSFGRTVSCAHEVTVNINDTAAPVPDVAQLPTITKSCTATVDVPTATDNCGGKIGGSTDDPRTYNVPGTYVINWKYTDPGGNTSSQDQTVVILPDADAPVPDVAQLPTLSGECSVTVTETPTATDNCSGQDMAGTTTDPLTYTTPGTHVVHWTYSDAAGNTTTQNQTVIVTDSATPTITAPADATYTCPAGVPEASPSQATAADNCGTPVVTVSETSTGTGSAASPRIITRTFKATDAGGNTATAVQTITVTDAVAPTITAPADIAVGNDAGSCSATLDPGTATATDNCGGATVGGARSDNQPLGAPYPKGVTTITWTATDAVGNTATAQQTVTVSDTEKPAVTVPADIVVTLAPPASSATSMAVSYAVTAVDNCDGVLTPVVSPASGSSFGVGTTTVTATATDAAGNVTTRTFKVTVLYDFAGFFQPVSENPEVLNQVKAGQSVPMKFSLSGDKGLGVLATSPVSVQIACPGNPTINDVSEVYTLAAGNSGLGYDALVDQYKYVWKTDSSWVNTCRQFILRLNDGSEHKTNFKFK